MGRRYISLQKKVHQYMLILVLFSFELGCCNLQNSAVFVNHLNEYGNKSNIPYQAQLIHPGDKSYFCGAAIISRTHLITAATCIKDKAVLYMVLVGSTIYRKGRPFAVEKIKIHPNFRRDSFENDIALLHLQHPLQFNSNVQRIPLASETMGKDGALYHGFDLTSLNDKSRLKTFEMTYHYCGNNFNDKMCALCSEHGCNSCKAHSGELLVQNRKLVGIVSRQSACIDPSLPIIFTRITSILDFIYRESSYLSDAKKKKGKKDSKGPIEVDYYVRISKKKGKRNVVCGGALISEKHFITSDKCMNDKDKYVVLLGTKGSPIDVKKVKTLKKKKSALGEAMKLGWLAAKKLTRGLFPLPGQNDKIKEGQTAQTVGHGSSKEDKLKEFLHHNFPVFSKACKQFALDLVYPICARDTKRTGAPCNLNSGAPVIMNKKLIGIIPMQTADCKKKKASPIIDVRPYVDEIMKLTKKLKE